MAGPALQYNPKGLDLGHVIQADLQKDHGRLFRKQRGRNLFPRGIALAGQLHGLDQQLDQCILFADLLEVLFGNMHPRPL